MGVKFLKTKIKTLAWCNKDWTGLHSIGCFVKEYGHSKDLITLKGTTFKVIKNLLEESFVIPGTLQSDNTFRPWNKELNETLFEIRKNGIL